MHKRFDNVTPQWTSLLAFLLILLFAGAADGLMETIGLDWFLAVGVPVMGLAWVFVEFGR